ncbi:MAG: HD domain-containing phosphohydrolase [Candidatus Sedimenticola sp. (ex Thyasira tokunagai)]
MKSQMLIPVEHRQQLTKYLADRHFDIGHGYRTARYAACFGLALGLASLQMAQLCNAALLHDFGKLQLPHKLLSKKGALTTTERNTVDTHTHLGAMLLSEIDSSYFHTASIVALTHHERWDGSGYPDGISGHSIPLFSRITTISDVFDALTTARSYKHAWSISGAIRFIDKGSEKLFDPGLVALFHSALPNILLIYRQRMIERINH